MKKMDDEKLEQATGGTGGTTSVNPNTSAGLCPDFVAKGELSEPGYPRCKDCIHCVAEETTYAIAEGVEVTKKAYYCELGL